MTQAYFPEAELKAALHLLQTGHVVQALAAYETIMREHRAQMAEYVCTVAGLEAHKYYLKHSIFQQILAQSDHGRGFDVNLKDYCFLDGPRPTIRVGPASIAAVKRYKGECAGISLLRTKAPDNIGNSPHAPAFLYYAHSVSADILDVCLLANTRAMRRVADFGAGAGMQATTLALIQPRIEAAYVFEVQDFMIDSITEMFETNRVAGYRINQPLDAAIDYFYSFRACGFLFSINEYYEQIKASRSAEAWASFDIGDAQDRNAEKAKLRTLFGAEHQLYHFGAAPHDYDRMIYLSPI